MTLRTDRARRGATHADPALAFREVPAYGAKRAVLERVATDVDRRSYRVAVYIEVGGGWWNESLWSHPIRKIKNLIPKDFEPPLRQGESALPFEIEQAAVARAEASRSQAP